MRKLAVVLIVICSVVQFSSAHFSLTYPIARYPDYDFLDNIRTGGPCGVPNGTWSALLASLEQKLSGPSVAWPSAAVQI